MKHSAENIVYHELIGLEVTVILHSDPTLVGLRGIVIDETRYTLKIRTREGDKRIPKLYGVFRFRLPSGLEVDVDGSLIVGRPEDRVKRVKFRRS
ncbi:MAG TPA: ribonuclease P protein subunit [Ignisphaera aggregans]|uniref:Ribonuclease P protein component 1 n=1 Tax=Ignisphaera aggregans TaxID=334771 RepID=A0A832YXI4_9CREN|nr:ribonuclease P protein subunit [Ignisphaera aggregans]